MLSDVEKGRNLMFVRLTPVRTLIGVMHEQSHTHAKRTIIGKKLPEKPNIFTLKKTENSYRLFSSNF